MARRVLVTGATGTVGGALMKTLAPARDRGEIELLGASRSPRGDEALKASGFTPVRLDYDAPETLLPALQDVDGLFLATGYSVDMLVHSKRLLDAARSAGVGHIVHLGALAAQDTPHAHFAWHQMVEYTIEAMGFEWTHLRPNFFMDTVWTGLRRNPGRLVHFVGDRPVSWISSDDMAAVAAEALRNPGKHAGKTYPLAVECLRLQELAGLLSSVVGRAVNYSARPAADLLPMMVRNGAEPVYAASLASGLAAIEQGNLPLADAVYDTVETVTGRPPVTWKTFAEARLAELPALP
jgi:uncharacterized protein YbjT (DUF2867 family)